MSRTSTLKVLSFQFTPLREGRRILTTEGNPVALNISIHAPPRGATSKIATWLQLNLHFNSRPSARGDKWRKTLQLLRFNFNSRPSARGDAGRLPQKRLPAISIHAPPRGATSSPRPGDVIVF